MPIIEGTTGTPMIMQGAPVSPGTDAIFTITIGGTVTGGNLGYFTWEGNKSGLVPWTASNTTLVAACQAALNSIPGLTGGGAVAAAGTATLGANGTLTVTCSGAPVAKRLVSAITLAGMALTGGSTAAMTYSTSGVSASFKNAGLGCLLIDTSTNGKIYHNNSGVLGEPTWTAQT